MLEASSILRFFCVRNSYKDVMEVTGRYRRDLRLELEDNVAAAIPHLAPGLRHATMGAFKAGSQWAASTSKKKTRAEPLDHDCFSS